MSTPILAKGIEPTAADIGRMVIYREFDGSIEEGVITGFNDMCVFVRYAGRSNSQATSRSDLDWSFPS